jgi:Tfp pilus assembly protein PilF
MARVWDLLDKAYLLINAGHMYQARSIINQIIARDPQNIEAWDVYIRTYTSISDLENLKGTVDLIFRSKVRDGDYLNANRRYILRRIDERIAHM